VLPGADANEPAPHGKQPLLAHGSLTLTLCAAMAGCTDAHEALAHHVLSLRAMM
jgi:hypothetical protein